MKRDHPHDRRGHHCDDECDARRATLIAAGLILALVIGLGLFLR